MAEPFTLLSQITTNKRENLLTVTSNTSAIEAISLMSQNKSSQGFIALEVGRRSNGNGCNLPTAFYPCRRASLITITNIVLTAKMELCAGFQLI
jgi:hypothetical protein